MTHRRTVIAALAALAATPLHAQTAPFPNRVIRIVPFGTAGGPIDTLARVYADKLQARWGQPVIVEAKPGASGIVAADFVAKAPPDGHTVMFTLPLTHVNNADPAAQAALRPGARLHAAVDAGHRRADAGGARRRALQQREGASSSSPRSRAGPDLRHLGQRLHRPPVRRTAEAPDRRRPDRTWPTRPRPPRTTTCSATRSTSPGPTRPPRAATAQAGKMKVLAIAGTRRVSIMPKVPTFKEQGFAGFDIDSWIGVYAPARPARAGGPDAWVTALREITAMPDVRAAAGRLRLRAAGQHAGGVRRALPRRLPAHGRADQGRRRHRRMKRQR